MGGKMAEPGDEIARSKDERILFRKTASETNGGLLEVDVTYRPGSSRPPEHYHPYQEERFEVLSGTIHAQIGQDALIYQAGDSFLIPAGVSHWMHNISDEQGRVYWQTRPAFNTETFFTTIWGLARDGKIDEGGPSLLQAAVIGREYAQEFRLTRPPYPIQRLLFALLAPIGRLLGYRTEYP
jgi:quercetin dioxygenase-like cupin family protein